jgi:hypothetical protein
VNRQQPRIFFYGVGLGDFFRSFVEEEARRMGKTLGEARTWRSPAKLGVERRKEVEGLQG